jgi:hypothetical protein
MDDELSRRNPRWLERINAQIPQFAEAFTLPIFRVAANGTATSHGTGTLFEIGGHAFLVSAAHVLKTAEGLEMGLCIPSADDDPARFIPLNGDAYFTSDDQDGHYSDPFDVIVWRIEPEIAKQLSTKRFIRQLDVADAGDRIGEFYFVFGYPSEWADVADGSSRSIESIAIAFVTDSVAANGSLENYDPRLHILLNSNLQSFRAADGSPLRRLSEWGGISGCSIWKLNINRENQDTWTPDQATIVAVETNTYRKGGLIRGSRWGLVVKLIHKEFPQLRPSLGLHFPRRVS